MGAQCCNNYQYPEDMEPCEDAEMKRLDPRQINIKYNYKKKQKVMNSSQTTKTQERTKQSAVTLKSGGVYQGDWIGNKREGYGILKWPDGSEYQGEWKNNKANGQGKFIYADGDFYEGQWENDKQNGQGIFQSQNGGKYEGQWKDDLQQGLGIETWEDGSRYEGYFYEGIKQGQGTYIWNDGSQYTGLWIDNKRHGQGVQVWKNGKEYQGEWFEDFMCGQGSMKWAQWMYLYRVVQQRCSKWVWNISNILDGKELRGQFQVIQAQWEREGYFQKNGQTRFGEWQEGKLMKWYDNQQEVQKENFDVLNLEDL
ncbi:unnamed protein product (macronuclear) [Paramecium tetraurelia]|uniref:MORN repeat protein n=1 Tax=Paramecium tetraurelia TaxID=5888 RepID=A0CGT9_PARTE|nr:uncharacterized protein GSPATT00007446001 [Paramecium tetraurelia]CAK70006.1 unnamed protein product [Paramecium tetraurelia]|eukprot:XP_001437403.1 hypothetical protein (macronuclear) [Paramecium tetraurelia strain d4-2]